MRALLASVVDYAGLFPPAGLDMPAAVSRYAGYRRTPQRWMLGSFVLPVSRAREFEQAAAELDGGDRGEAWPISLLLGPQPFETAAAVEELRERWRNGHAVGSVEVPPLEAEQIVLLAASIPEDVATFFEVPVGDGLNDRLAAVADCGALAKVRTGGVSADAFPSVVELARFVAACRHRGVPFKATAGLHHPIRGPQPLTYETDAERAWMHGFLNLTIASCLIDVGRAEEGELVEALSESSAYAFGFRQQGIVWRDREVPEGDILRTRRGFFHSFGSCSFEEPVIDLEELGLL